MTIDANTGIETWDYDLPGWVHVYNKNIDLINAALLKLMALQDVHSGYTKDDGLLTWNAASGKWVMRNYK